MAKFEREGYCPYIWVPKTWNEQTNSSIKGLWDLIGPAMVYQKKDEVQCPPDTERCDRIFGVDSISYNVLVAIVEKNVNADKILIHQLHNGALNIQSISDIQKILKEATNPQLVLHAGSDFAVVLADAEYGMDVWIWDLKTCK